MAGQKVWRDAASLILAAKCPAGKNLPRGCKSDSTQKITEPIDCSNYFDYKVLMLKRRSKSKFMPNAYVFPGGVIAQADFARGWRDLFRDFGYTEDDLEELVLKDVDRPMLMKAELDESITRDIAFRLATIRETFEESGVLLVKSSTGSSSQSEAYSFSSSSSLNSWQTKVHSNPEELLSLYRQVGAVPDLWAVKEWSNWLTPTDLHEQGKRRFDTIFYTACLDSIPTTLLDQAEVTAVQWTDPASLLHQFYDRQLWLAPPQVYELSRLLNFRAQHDLGQFSEIRHQKGLTTWLPIRMECEDGILALLPGDSLYPASPDYEGNTGQKSGVYPGSLSDSLAASEQLNRLEFRDNYDCVPRVSCDSQHGHIHPCSYQEFQINQLNMVPKVGDCKFCPEKQRRFCQSQPCTQWRLPFTSQELLKKRGNKKLEERFMQKTREYPTFPG
eukprot:GFUD01044052.1.p1 GENE.GFUD01044052.1~~GFUD01044052.1.p1  ORF type:complete len:444 (+),score=141.66 GFUD01044052.1:111-1442(+)